MRRFKSLLGRFDRKGRAEEVPTSPTGQTLIGAPFSLPGKQATGGQEASSVPILLPPCF